MANKIWLGNDTGNEGDWSVAANWSPSGVPANGDDVYLENSSQDVDGGLNQSAVTLSSLNIEQSFTGSIGTSSAYLQIGATNCDIGQHYGPGTPAGSPMIKLDLGSAQSAVVVHNTGTSSDSNRPTVRLKLNHASSTVEVRKGKVGIAFETGETSTISKLTVSYVTQIDSDADVFVGPGVTCTTLDVKGGETILQCAMTTVNGYKGTLTTVGSGAITTINAKGATIYPNSTGTITTLTITDGTVDFRRSAAARTVTTPKLDEPGVLKFDPAVITFTNKITSNNPVVYTASAA